jgi:ABC-type transport system involved in multi-copper enzyme maturation permease subunit
MKYLAILKDSFREAVDSKVIYVTLGLAVLVILVVGSVSFTPLPAEESFKTITDKFRLVNPDRGKSWQVQFFNVQYKIENLEKLNVASEPQQGDYRFRLRVDPADQFERAVAFWVAPPKQRDDEVLANLKKKADGKQDGWKAAMDVAKLWLPFGGKAKVTREQAEDYIKGMFSYHGNVSVTGVTPKGREGNALVYEVTTEGTKGVRGWPHEPGLFFGLLPMSIFRSSLSTSVFFITNALVGGIGAWVTIILSVIITAFFIPNMLRKGTIDLLLAKPIQRVSLLVYKYLGGLSFIFINTAAVVAGVFLVLGLRSGLWVTGFLWMIPILTFFFAILYAVSTLMGVLTRSAIVAILVTIAFWFVCFLGGTFYNVMYAVKQFQTDDKLPEWVYTSANLIHAGLPRTSDLGNLTDRLVYEQVLTEAEIRRNQLNLTPPVNWAESVGVSFGWIVLFLGLACWRFAVKDY